jgi:hypothetical protein
MDGWGVECMPLHAFATLKHCRTFREKKEHSGAVFLQKIMAFQLVNKFPAFYES